MNQVNEVAGTVEVQTLKQLSKVKTREATKRDKLNIRKKNKDYQSKVAKINDVMKSDISKFEKVNKHLKYSEKIELLHDWVLTDDNLGENSLKWNTIMNTSITQFSFWHKDFIIDEQMIPYIGMHSAKQVMRNKTTSFGYKNFF